jgi:hypothetical protein
LLHRGNGSPILTYANIRLDVQMRMNRSWIPVWKQRTGDQSVLPVTVPAQVSF